jgi:hypothetical protein
MGTLISGFQEAMMPRGPKGEKRPADVIGNAVHVMRIATGEVEETAPTKKESRAKKGGAKGGPARAQALSPEQRSEIARTAASARWKKTR